MNLSSIQTEVLNRTKALLLAELTSNQGYMNEKRVLYAYVTTEELITRQNYATVRVILGTDSDEYILWNKFGPAPPLEFSKTKLQALGWNTDINHPDNITIYRWNEQYSYTELDRFTDIIRED